MRSIKELLKLPFEELTPAERVELQKYMQLKKYRHSGKFIYHSRKLPEEPHGKPHED